MDRMKQNAQVVQQTDRGLLSGIEPTPLWRGGSGPYQPAWVWAAVWAREIGWSGPSKLAWLRVSSTFLGGIWVRWFLTLMHRSIKATRPAIGSILLL